jgi:hypothetical protein
MGVGALFWTRWSNFHGVNLSTPLAAWRHHRAAATLLFDLLSCHITCHCTCYVLFAAEKATKSSGSGTSIQSNEVSFR